MTFLSGKPLVQLTDKVGQLYHCADCNYCVDAVWQERQWNHVCPTLAHHSSALSYSGRGYMILARAIHEGAEFPLEDIAERVFTCTSCGNCERVCPIGLSPRDVNLALREVMVSNDAIPEALIALKDQWQAGSEAGYEEETSLDMADLLFLGGCESDPATDDNFKLLKQLNPNAAMIGAAGTCCGANLAALGFASEALEAAEVVSDRINIYPRVDTIVLASPKCQKSLRADSRLISLPAWLSGKMDSGEISSTLVKPSPLVTYMSVCSDPAWNTDVRQLLNGLAKQNQLSIANPHDDSSLVMCCGAGGGLPVMAKESAASMAKAKLEDLSVNASESVLLVADPGCLEHLKATHATPAKLYGIGEFLSEYFEFSIEQD